MRTLSHIGIPVNYKPEGAVYNEGLNIWLTDYSQSPNKIEFIHLESGETPLLLSKKKVLLLKLWK